MKEKFASIRKYNYWDGQRPDIGFLRTDYTDKIAHYVDSRLVKVLVGQRRTGKSYILRQIAHQLIEKGLNPVNIFYLNKEFTEFDFVDNNQSLENLYDYYKKTLQPSGKKYLFLDEIQNIDGWERFVNSHSQDFTDDCDIYLTGSNSKMLSGELATLLSGRYVNFAIYPFSFDEYLKYNTKQADKQQYINYMQSGGLPELFVLPNEDSRRNYISALKDTVLLRDIIHRYNIKDAKMLEDLFIYLVNNVSNLTSISNIVNYYKSINRKTTYDTLSNYIGYLEDAFIIHRVERYDIRGKEALAGNCKYYANDLSYKNYLYPGFAGGIGYALENIVYLQLRISGYKVYVGALRDKEIDFVAQKDDRTVYIQVSYLLADEQTITREYAPLFAIPDNYAKYIVSLDDVAFQSNKGIEHVQAWRLHEKL
jgi:predicted AAA+ superfamily ATPase